MLVRTDDEVYRIDAVWLGPPRATFPWRARYVSYGVGLLVMMVIMFVQRRLGVPLDFFSIAWSLVGTVAITRLLGKKITYERPFGQVVTQFWAEVTGPRARTGTGGGAVRAAHVRIHPTRSRPPAPRRKAAERRPATPVSGPSQAPRAVDRGSWPAPEPAAWSSRRSRDAGAVVEERAKPERIGRTGPRATPERTRKGARRGRG